MTVRELIAKLGEFDPDAKVVAFGSEYDSGWLGTPIVKYDLLDKHVTIFGDDDE